MSSSYGQYCPLALATEVLCQRWTILVISRLLDGCTRFNSIHRGLPKMSPSLLSQRLAELESAGIVQRRQSVDHAGYGYFLTQSGWDLEDIVMRLAVWGQNWGREMSNDDLDPAFLAWSMHLRMDVDAMPDGTLVIEFCFSGIPEYGKAFWLLKEGQRIDMCLKDPGLEVDLVVNGDLRVFIEAWRGFRDLRQEIRCGSIVLNGPDSLCRSFPDWLLLSSLSPYERKRKGRERTLSREQCVDEEAPVATSAR